MGGDNRLRLSFNPAQYNGPDDIRSHVIEQLEAQGLSVADRVKNLTVTTERILVQKGEMNADEIGRFLARPDFADKVSKTAQQEFDKQVEEITKLGIAHCQLVSDVNEKFDRVKKFMDSFQTQLKELKSSLPDEEHDALSILTTTFQTQAIDYGSLVVEEMNTKRDVDTQNALTESLGQVLAAVPKQTDKPKHPINFTDAVQIIKFTEDAAKIFEKIKPKLEAKFSKESLQKILDILSNLFDLRNVSITAKTT